MYQSLGMLPDLCCSFLWECSNRNSHEGEDILLLRCSDFIWRPLWNSFHTTSDTHTIEWELPSQIFPLWLCSCQYAFLCFLFYSMCFSFLFVCTAPALEEDSFQVISNYLFCPHHSAGIHCFLTVHSSNTALKTKLPNHYYIIILQSHNIIYFQNNLRDEEHLEAQT